jgi:hypothetical protein
MRSVICTEIYSTRNGKDMDPCPNFALGPKTAPESLCTSLARAGLHPDALYNNNFVTSMEALP